MKVECVVEVPEIPLTSEDAETGTSSRALSAESFPLRVEYAVIKLEVGLNVFCSVLLPSQFYRLKRFICCCCHRH